MGPFKRKLQIEQLTSQRGKPLRNRLLALRKVPTDEKRRAIARKSIKAWVSNSEETVRRAWEKAKLLYYDKRCV
ncbi:TPA: hypothetical protein N0F65_005705 [Lagenidium giganteum]|uniref:Uncharacterized protein n=1 Tax=Lagenidium giganteum TaxID=4803 RepID=A0AAV2ZI10_9STRA|nr:TPA: hypothetical protein N0F65_005705 [Lagenidium giganteum]